MTESHVYHGDERTPYTVEIVDITPALAQVWLNLNHPENRAPSRMKQAQYGRDMLTGHWMPNGEAVKFDSLGRLMDGQNRLLAVIRTGITVPMFVFRELPPAAFHTLDHGYSRPMLWWINADTRATAVAMTTVCGGAGVHVSGTRPTESEMEAFMQKHSEAVTFAVGAMGRQTGVTAVTRAIIARAFYHVDRTILRDFVDCLYLRQVFSPRRQTAVMRLRDILNSGGSNRSRTSGNAKDRYLKTERCVMAFVRDEPISRLYKASGELFPIDEDSWASVGVANGTQPAYVDAESILKTTENHGSGKAVTR